MFGCSCIFVLHCWCLWCHWPFFVVVFVPASLISLDIGQLFLPKQQQDTFVQPKYSWSGQSLSHPWIQRRRWKRSFWIGLSCEMLSVILQWYFKKLAILLQFNTWNIIFLPLEITEQQDLSFHSTFYLGDKILICDCCLQDKTLSERRRECKRFWEIWQTCFTNFIPAQIRYLIHARISKSGLGWHHLEIKKIDKKTYISFKRLHIFRLKDCNDIANFFLSIFL